VFIVSSYPTSKWCETIYVVFLFCSENSFG